MKVHSYVKFSFLMAIFAFLFSQGCQKIEFEDSTKLDLSFSIDTLTFDTVFTQVGSTTKYFKIYNHGTKYARIAAVKLKSSPSPFRLNVDGVSGHEIKDVEIPPKDSIYVFVEVTVDPDQPLSESPFIIEEDLLVETGAQTHSVLLTAWGQNANYIPALGAKRRQTLITCDFNDWTWDDPKPYVIYGVIIVDSCNLIIPEGKQIYIHGGLVPNGQNSYQDGVLFIGKNGRLEINGTAQNPVTIQTDRLEKDYQEFVGQWGRIQLGPESKNNKISYTHIQHGGIGILVDSLAELSMDHSTIGFNGEVSLASYRGIIDAENCLFHTSAGFNLTITLGGFYRFKHCTFVNTAFNQSAVFMRNSHCFNVLPEGCQDFRVAALNLEMENCIIYSDNDDGLILQNGHTDPAFFKVKFNHTLLNAKDLISESEYPNFFADHPTAIHYQKSDPLFYDTNDFNFSLDSLSVAKDQGKILPEINDDILGLPRDEAPDLGAYEWID